MRRLLAAASIGAILCIQAFPAAAAPSGRVVLVTLDGTRLSDWRARGLSELGALLRHGAVGLLSTRTAETEDLSLGVAFATLGSGRISRKADPTAMMRALDPHAVVIGVHAGVLAIAADRTGQARRLPDRTDVAFPGGTRTDLVAAREVVADALRTARVVVLEVGDTTQVEDSYGLHRAQRERWMRLAMTRIDPFLRAVREMLAPEDTLIVASLTPPQERGDARRFLSVVAASGPGLHAGTLTSSSTRRDGVVTIPDLTATILDRAGAAIPNEMSGNPMEIAPGDVDTLAAKERDLIHASVVRGPLIRGTVIIGASLAVLAVLTVLAGRGRGGRQRGVPTTWRGLLETGLIAVATVPLVLLLEPTFGTASLTGTVLVVAGVTVGGAAILRAVLGSRVTIATVVTTTIVLVLFDLLAGGGLAERSPLSYLIAEGARFHGIGNDAMGVVIGGGLFAAAALLDRDLATRRVILAAVGLGVAAIIMAAPPLGAKFGAVPAAVPAFALFCYLATGRRFDLAAAIGIAIVTVLGAGIVVAADLLRESGTHVANAVGGGGGEILGRKAGAAGRLLALSYWMGAIVAGGGSLALLAWRRPSLLGRALWGRPATRRALACTVVAGAGCIATNDAGVTAAAWIALIAAASVFSLLLVPADS